MIPIESGNYIAEITNHYIAETSESRTPHVGIDILLKGRIDPANPTADPLPSPPSPRTIKLWLTDRAVERTISDLRALKWTGASVSQLDLTSENAVSLVGTVIYVTCTLDQDGDRIRENWSIARPRKSLSDERIAALDVKYGHLFENMGN